MRSLNKELSFWVQQTAHGKYGETLRTMTAPTVETSEAAARRMLKIVMTGEKEDTAG
jgi:hypothetical protein